MGNVVDIYLFHPVCQAALAPWDLGKKSANEMKAQGRVRGTYFRNGDRRRKSSCTLPILSVPMREDIAMTF